MKTMSSTAWVQVVFYVCLAIALLTNCLGYLGLRNAILFAPGIMLCALWLPAMYYGWQRLSGWLLLGWLSWVAFGLWLNQAPYWFIFSAAGALAAWDLHEFSGQIRNYAGVRISNEMVFKHLIRLGLVTLVGITLAILALVVKLQLRFGLALFLGFWVFVGLAQLVQSLRQRSSEDKDG